MKRIHPKQLKKLFLLAFEGRNGITYEEGNPFLITINRKKHHVFLKNLSPAYYSNNPDITRIQLPYSPHFKKISKYNFPFIILGYDSYFDTFTAWDPDLIKTRLNLKKNVSLFSRESFQKKLRLHQFNQHRISNGDKVIIFKRNSIVAFIKNYKNLFEITTPELKTRALRNRDGGKKSNISSTGKIRFIDDLYVMKKVEKYLSANNIIDAVLYCSNLYAKEFPKMKLADWTLLIKKMKGKDFVVLR